MNRRESEGNTVCRVLSIHNQRGENDDTKYTRQCKPWRPTEDDCAFAEQFYSIKKDIYCREKLSNTSRKICSFAVSNLHKYDLIENILKIHCDQKICQEGRLFVGSVNPEIGTVTSQDWEEFPSAKLVETALPGIISDNIKNGNTFSLIRCVKKNENIDQLLFFPHILEHKEKTGAYVRFRQRYQRKPRRKTFNINVVLLDSVSRNHFYRMLNKTVNILRKTAQNPEVLVLDYEFFQSLAPYTAMNTKGLLTGTTGKDANEILDKKLEINNLYGQLKKRGYRTLFQEDNCWYDKWGTIFMNNIRKDKLPQNIEEFKKSFEQFRNFTKISYVDDYGLTLFSCFVFNMHGITNMFNEPLKVCYDGQPISTHFLRYTEHFFSHKGKRPLFSYLHTGFGHEKTGIRIKALDEDLSVFIRNMAQQKNTLTILASDHGPKTTTYSQDYLHGKYEIYDALLFMIIPKRIQKELGTSRVDALVKNQKSLVTMLDIHNMLIDMTQLRKRGNRGGLFSDISNRTCDSLPFVSYGVCKCRDWEQIFMDQSPRFVWLAEFATEKLNNKILEQFSKSNRSGFGKCRKLRLHRIWNIRQRVKNGSYITTFDLVVQPSYTVFLVQTEHSISDEGLVDKVELKSWRRVSLYRRYISCKDKPVDVELCVCNLRQRNSKKRMLRKIANAKVSKNNEIFKTQTSCLYILLTKGEDKLQLIFSYDIINICDERYIFTLYGGRKIVKELQPYSDTFLHSLVVKDNRKPVLRYRFKRT
ncbi:uncharacterized protein LOC114519711 [Dendronephthya gigantea]|uniref:uncharacterized protein LOC114519711 n=1 Tax=Dendronephthya gigantea TaxID=151771 RepID=UPI00106BD179|nr:uncharacterized protein LOC114519711 [Dendronephthya gigantea]